MQKNKMTYLSKVKVTCTLYTTLRATMVIKGGLQAKTPAENLPNLGVRHHLMMMRLEAAAHHTQGQHTILSSCIGLVSILHLGMVRL